MKVAASGISHKTKKSSFKPIIVDDFRKKILEGLKKNSAEIKPEDVDRGVAFRALEPVDAANPAKPEEAGWTFLINKKDSLGEQIIEAIHPLARYRGMDGVDSPLIFNDTPEEFWGKWIDKYLLLRKGEHKQPPKYVLIIGGPNSIPIEFQSRLSNEAFVGRIDFDDVKQVKAYAEKVKGIEESDKAFVNKEVAFFATDHGISNSGVCYYPTHFSRFDVEKELVPNVDRLNKGFKPNPLIEADATKQNLRKSIQDSKPCLVYASSWGMFAPGESMDLQKKITGAICCQGDPEKVSYKDLLLTADDISSDAPFLEGGVFFQHSSFSYGAPAVSDLNQWISEAEKWEIPKQIAPTDFVAALPKKLVFHPKGPLAFIGHFDEVLSYTYALGEDSHEEARPERLQPISKTIEHLLLGRPVGFALGDMNQRYHGLSIELADLSAKLNKKNKSGAEKEKEPDQLKRLSDLFLQWYEAKNYMIFGDPAVRL